MIERESGGMRGSRGRITSKGKERRQGERCEDGGGGKLETAGDGRVGEGKGVHLRNKEYLMPHTKLINVRG